ncbi:quinolinate synthase NadA [Candidatus Peregrinibacteria bacterium]|nr:quinolinate synthase NadA [Candidatus Peregrinibacteria bacterium]
MYFKPAVKLTKEQKTLIGRIRKLKKEKNAIVLCHNYQRPEIYEAADFIGDSLELCRKAATVSAKIIVFSGVYFMAESAAVLNPGVKVLIPDRSAGCALSDMITAEALRREKKKYPDAAVVCYVNSNAEVKAESDVCCTSGNAIDIVRALPNRRILFVPDKNLANFVAKQVPEKEIIPWDGYCPIHERLTAEYLIEAKKQKPNAKIIAHPECPKDVLAIADYVASTSGMLKVAEKSDADEFICTTECGMVQRLSRALPHKKFYTVCSVCFDMKKNTLELIEESLIREQYEVKVPEKIARKARKAFERMFEMTEALTTNC